MLNRSRSSGSGRGFWAPLLAALLLFAGRAPAADAALPAYTPPPQTFEPNVGQAESRVDFLSRGSGYTLLLTATEADLEFVRAASQPGGSSRHASVHMKLLGANSRAKAQGHELQTAASNYLIGNQPAAWRTGIPQYGRVEYRGVYPGIDLTYYGSQRQLEYDFLLTPQADPRDIRLAMDGADRVRINAAGDLVIVVGGAEIRQRKPTIYQQTADGRRRIEGRYVLRGLRQVGFEVAAYDRKNPLVIDPVLVFSTYFGGQGDDRAGAMWLDAAGNMYLCGVTTSSNLPSVITLGQPLTGGTDAFVVKMNPAGKLIFVTYVGGSNDQASCNGGGTDANGNVYLAGITAAPNFPVLKPIQGTYHGAEDGFALALNSSGNALIYSTYLGGSGLDYARAMAVDPAGNAYVTGSTASPEFPILNAEQPKFGGVLDTFAMKIAPGGSLIYSTFIGGSQTDFNNGMSLDGSGNVYVFGDTNSVNFPVVRPVQGKYSGGQNVGWLAKLDPSGNVAYATYFGGTSGDAVRGAAADAAGNVVIAGETRSLNFPVVNAIQPHYGGGAYDAFVAKLNANGSAVLYSTYLGGSGEDHAGGVALDSLGNAYVTGLTFSTDFPVANAIQNTNAGNSDVFLTKINAGGSAIIFSTYLGGSGADTVASVAVDAAARAYLGGITASPDFPLAAPTQRSYGGGANDAFLAVIATCSLTFTPPNAVLGLSGGTGRISINTTPECGWNTASNSSWLNITSFSSGSGSGTVSFSAAPNATAVSGTITIGAQSFTVLESGPVTLSSIAPASAVAGGALQVVLTGSNFVPGATLTVSNPAVTVGNVAVVSPTQINAVLNIPATASAGPATLTVSTLAGAGGPASFTIVPPVPLLSSVVPAGAPAGSSVNITLNGSYLAGATVTVDNPAVSVSTTPGSTPNQVVVSMNIPANAQTGAMNICVTTAGGTSTTLPFNISPPATPIASAVNAASNAAFGLPNSAIAQGALLVFYGKSIGPTSLQQARYPLPFSLGQTSATVTVNGATLQLPIVYTSSTQVAMIMPSNTPVGSGTVTVSYNAQTTAAAPVQVVPSNFGIFTLNQGGSGPAVVTDINYHVITLLNPAQPEQALTLWGTGLGAISGTDNTPPPAGNVGAPVTVYVGSQQATVLYQGRSGCCSGLDQINFVVPDGVSGCYVPVSVQTAGGISNFATVAVANNGTQCSDANGFSAAQLQTAASAGALRLGTLGLNRSTMPAGSPVADSATAQFSAYTADQLVRSLGPFQAPSVGTCTVFAFPGYAANITDPVQSKGLDAGQMINIAGPNGQKQLSAGSQLGTFSASLGSSLNSGQLYLNAGTYSFNGPGGANVRGIQGQAQMPPSVVWTNQNSLAVIDRSQPATVTWSGGAADGFVYIYGVSVAVPQESDALWTGAEFACVAPAGDGHFTVPAYVLQALPASASKSGAAPLSYLTLRSVAAPQSFSAVGLDTGIAMASSGISGAVTFR
jgi:uncharacterized protein (TIGR03437 family)